jgi:hypothetical protein
MYFLVCFVNVRFALRIWFKIAYDIITLIFNLVVIWGILQIGLNKKFTKVVLKTPLSADLGLYFCKFIFYYFYLGSGII